MIDLEKLKPILEGIAIDADVIDAIIALDVPVDGSSELQSAVDQLQGDLDAAKAELDTLNATWQDRYKKAFFGQAEDLPDINQEDNQETKYEGDIFTPYVEKEEE